MKRRKRFAIVIGVAAAGVMALGALATAHSTSYNDPEMDNTGNNCPPTNPRYCHKSFDFVKVSADHSGANLVFKATVRGKAKNPPLLSISTDKAKDCEYELGIPAGSDIDGPGDQLVGKNTVVNCDTKVEAPAKYVGKAGERGFKFVFSPDSIGNPNKYRWQFAYLADRGVVGDEAPNKPDVFLWFGRPCPAANYPCK
jgi:hypothetical protein